MRTTTLAALFALATFTLLTSSQDCGLATSVSTTRSATLLACDRGGDECIAEELMEAEGTDQLACDRNGDECIAEELMEIA
ncbi:MAG: hypothetical protein R3E01_09985 [Pirellulaceae bacterium]|nr:hypothetical protein [Planctomycetales bacterium]